MGTAGLGPAEEARKRGTLARPARERNASLSPIPHALQCPGPVSSGPAQDLTDLERSARPAPPYAVSAGARAVPHLILSPSRGPIPFAGGA